MRRVLAVLLVTLASCSSGGGTTGGGATDELVIDTGSERVSIRVEVADDEAERETGLMGRESLPEDAGMAFLWSDPVRVSFWMKDTLIPLSIAFWDADGSIISILDMAPCRADPCPTYDPGAAFVGALEVNEGFFASRGVEVGDVIATEAFL